MKMTGGEHRHLLIGYLNDHVQRLQFEVHTLQDEVRKAHQERLVAQQDLQRHIRAGELSEKPVGTVQEDRVE